MKLLLDENLSDRIISRVADLFPDSTHIKAVGLREADDFGEEAWVYDCIKGNRFSSKGYCVWPPAEVHMEAVPHSHEKAFERLQLNFGTQ